MRLLHLLSTCISCLVVGCGALRLREQAISTLPGLQSDIPVDPDGKHGPVRTSGYFRLNRTEEAEMFYFYFQSRGAASDPVVVWMTGGPGCSSELAVFFENGPFKLQEDLSLKENAFGWDVAHHMVYVDQPIGTGYSYSKDPRDSVNDEEVVGEDMVDFLREFFTKHPELASNDLYITGESYAGHYVPVVTHHIWKWNKQEDTSFKFKLKGFGIGNGLTNAGVQYSAYGDYAYENGLIGRRLKNFLKWTYRPCHLGCFLCNYLGWDALCVGATAYCQSAVYQPVLEEAGNINVYDIRRKCNGALCYERFDKLAEYLAQKDVMDALGVTGKPAWSECSASVYARFLHDFPLEYSSLVAPMLEDGVRALIYVGDQDFICNWVGNRRWVDALPWSGSAEWHAAEDVTWRPKVATESPEGSGEFRTAGPLTFLRIYGAGHLVPMDKGEESFDMIRAFTRDKMLPS